MTTVTYHHKDKQVAIDSRYTRGEIIDSDKGDKVRKDDRGTWLFAGSQADFEDLMTLSKDQKVEVRPDCGAILISEGRAYTVDTDNDGYCVIAELTGDFAMGSGANFALAALDFGKSAKDAVNYAKTRDIYTGGKVRVFNVK
jgi:ATP-dependent protease HslVU (ClpYQ) peptidase subunit